MSKNIFGSSSLVKLISLIKNTIDSKYTKPSTGIPKTDLASSIQTSLGKADTALQSYTEKYTGTYTKPDRGIPKTDLANSVQATLDKADTALQSYTEIYTGTYSKPSTGIPKTDLASSVQTSLGKADTALQSHQDISGKQDKSDNSLATTSKTVVGAINEINEKDKSTTINGISSVINVTTDNKLAEIVNLKGLSKKSSNILAPTLATTTKNNVTITNNGDGTYTLNGTASADFNIDLHGALEVTKTGTYKLLCLNRDYAEKVEFDAFVNDYGHVFRSNTKAGSVYNIDSVGKILCFRLYVTNGIAFNNDIFKPMLTMDTSLTYDDYMQANTIDSNPIVEIKSVGKNIIDFSACTDKKFISSSDGSIYNYEQAMATDYIEVESGCSYYFSGMTTLNSGNTGACYDVNKQFIRGINSDVNIRPFTIPSGCKYIRLSLWKSNYNDITKAQLEKGTTSTTYSPYKNDTYTIPTESREKLISMGYGMGINADVNNGIFFKQTYRNMKSIDLGTLGWVYNSANAIFYSTTDVGIVTSTNTTANILCDKYAYEDVEWSSHSNKTIGVRKNLYLSDVVSLVVKDTSYTSVSDFKSAMSGVIARCECADNSGQEYKAIVYKKKCASRSYQSGDESNTNYLTDGSTTTIYPLTTEQIYDVTDLLHSDNILSVEKGGTITLIDSSGVAKSVPSTITILGNADATVRLNEIVRGNETEDADNSIIGDSWTSSKTYTVGEYAISGDKLWKCKVQNTNTIPSEGTYWKCVSVTDVLTPTVVTRTWTNGFYKMVNNNGIVTITMNLVTPSTMMALTDEFKPKNDMFLPLIDLNTHQYVYLYITSSGTISVHTISQSQLSDYKLYGSVTYHTF